MSEKRSVDDVLAKDAVHAVREETTLERVMRVLAQHGSSIASFSLILFGAVFSAIISILSDKLSTQAFQLFASLIGLAAGYLFATQSKKD